MSYGYNDNTYTTLKRVEAYDTFCKNKQTYDAGTDIDSSIAHGIIVTTDEQEQFKSLTPQECIDLKVTLGYIELKR